MKRSKFKPVCVYDAMGFIRLTWIAAEKTGEVVSLLVTDTTRYEVFAREIMEGQLGPVGGRTRYIISGFEPEGMAEAFKTRAMTHGATPEAIRLLKGLVPISKEEEYTMAEKLKGKAGTATAPTKGNAEALKAAAKAAPVGGKKAAATVKPKAKGNMAGLEKAREVRSAGTEARDKQKITVINKNHSARDGSNRANMLNIVLRSKTVGAAIEAGATWIDIKFARDSGLISLA